MQKNNDDELLKAALKKKLDWYTMYATEEEYNEADVEHILSLLDSLEPLEKGEIPPVEEAWGRFCQMRENPRELLPLEKDVPLEKEVSLKKEVLFGTGDSVSIERDTRVSCKTGEPVSVGSGETDVGKKNSDSYEKLSAPTKDRGKIIKFVLRHKAIVAAIFLVMVLAVGRSIQTGAIKNSGFFFWLNRDETGTDIFTSPEILDGGANAVKTSTYSDRNDMPEWTQDWLKIEAEFELPSNYEWQCFQITELDYMLNIISCYSDKDSNRDMILGIFIYTEEVYYNRDRFANYDLIDSYEIDHGKMEVYRKTEEAGELSYTICFYEGNCEYFVSMPDDLEELKKLTEQYWNCAKKYL